MRVVSYNIRFGGGRRLAAIGAVLAHLEPDVVLLQEATDPVALGTIARIAGLGHTYSRPGEGVAALTRRPTLSHDWHEPTIGRPFLELVPADEPDLRLVGIHLPSGLSARGERARLRVVGALLAWSGGAVRDDTLLIGDLNSVARGDVPVVATMPLWLRILLRVDGGITTAVQDRLAEAGWVDAFRHLNPGLPGFTLPAARPRVRLDYALVPRPVLGAVAACGPATAEPLAAGASDHLPLVVDLR